MQVTVQAGARVQAVADELRKHGLSLQNYASIREQTVGGFTQVGGGAGVDTCGGQGVLLGPLCFFTSLHNFNFHGARKGLCAWEACRWPIGVPPPPPCCLAPTLPPCRPVAARRQVSAHGTGAAIPPVDEQVVGLKLVTPALGTIQLSKVGRVCVCVCI